MENNYYIFVCITGFCMHGNLTFKGHCPFAMAVPLIRCTTYTEGNSYSESFIEGSDNSSHASEESGSESFLHTSEPCFQEMVSICNGCLLD